MDGDDMLAELEAFKKEMAALETKRSLPDDALPSTKRQKREAQAEPIPIGHIAAKPARSVRVVGDDEVIQKPAQAQSDGAATPSTATATLPPWRRNMQAGGDSAGAPVTGAQPVPERPGAPPIQPLRSQQMQQAEFLFAAGGSGASNRFADGAAAHGGSMSGVGPHTSAGPLPLTVPSASVNPVPQGVMPLAPSIVAAAATGQIKRGEVHGLFKASGKSAVRVSDTGERWVDPTLGEWPENDFRLFCGDLGNDCTDDVLAAGFCKYPSFAKAKIVRDKKSGKTKGFGFVSFLNADDYFRAFREMNGKYIGNRPVKLRKSKWQERNDTSNARALQRVAEKEERRRARADKKRAKLEEKKGDRDDLVRNPKFM